MDSSTTPPYPFTSERMTDSRTTHFSNSTFGPIIALGPIIQSLILALLSISTEPLILAP